MSCSATVGTATKNKTVEIALEIAAALAATSTVVFETEALIVDKQIPLHLIGFHIANVANFRD